MTVEDVDARRALLRRYNANQLCAIFSVLASRLMLDRDRDCFFHPVHGAALLYAAPYPLMESDTAHLPIFPPGGNLRDTYMRRAMQGAYRRYREILDGSIALKDSPDLVGPVQQLSRAELRQVAYDVLHVIGQRIIDSVRRAPALVRVEHGRCRCAAAASWALRPSCPIVDDAEWREAGRTCEQNAVFRHKLCERLLRTSTL